MATKLTITEKQILGFLIYPETFHSILEESGMPRGSLRDDVMNLVSRGYLVVYDREGKHPLSPFYDTDNLEDFSFKATKLGLDAIRNDNI